jgi:DNA-binding PadR family transcriptional regulator
VPPMAQPTELELLILGIVAKFGPLTPYAVRRHFAESPNPAFSSSAGTIYPAMERLEAAGLLRSRAAARGQQARRTYATTAAGRRAHEAWLFEELDDAVFAPPPDPLRFRLYFLGLLPRAAQRRFLDTALARLEAELPRQRRYAEGYAPEGPTLYSRLASEGMVELTQARLRWLTRVRRELFGA